MKQKAGKCLSAVSQPGVSFRGQQHTEHLPMSGSREWKPCSEPASELVSESRELLSDSSLVSERASELVSESCELLSESSLVSESASELVRESHELLSESSLLRVSL